MDRRLHLSLIAAATIAASPALSQEASHHYLRHGATSEPPSRHADARATRSSDRPDVARVLHSRRGARPPRNRAARAASTAWASVDAAHFSLERIVPHPQGCPWRRFCGCGVSVRVFGRPIRSLFLAANWRRFPPASPAPGRVAWRYGHVFYIEAVHGDGTVTAYDPNSGGHLTRIHRVSLRGYHVVDPRG